MPWKSNGKVAQRLAVVREMKTGLLSVKEICKRAHITRQNAYKWLRRYREFKEAGLIDRSRKPLSLKGKTSLLWLRRVRQYRRKHPTWGARKLRHKLMVKFPDSTAPALATINRWLKVWGLTRGRRRRRPGPTIMRKGLHVPLSCHEVWTVDFKGWYRTGDGRRTEPLTVRDLFSRYSLAIKLLPNQSILETEKAFNRIFRKHGVPKRIRCDNGTPFGGAGPTGLTRLSAWWVKLGIEVEFITPGCPYENGAHEQFHRVYKAEVAKKPAYDQGKQQVRTTRWLRSYNEDRPHEGLEMKSPADIFKKNERRMPQKCGKWTYPKGWERRWVKGNGEISRKGKRRFVGEAFVRDYVGLEPKVDGVWNVYFGPVLVGELYENEEGNIRIAKHQGAR